MPVVPSWTPLSCTHLFKPLVWCRRPTTQARETTMPDASPDGGATPVAIPPYTFGGGVETVLQSARREHAAGDARGGPQPARPARADRGADAQRIEAEGIKYVFFQQVSDHRPRHGQGRRRRRSSPRSPRRATSSSTARPRTSSPTATATTSASAPRSPSSRRSPTSTRSPCCPGTRASRACTATATTRRPASCSTPTRARTSSASSPSSRRSSGCSSSSASSPR